eukprot:gnl/MRDRNA2_/MRDRNA2_86537_c0_seq1.p1 gnl/MRDRNA2_/MRDRNA2_86537_c0~~gnl/MRDRNA2_/MRDRNA2_86537_c0_seq1.p1  ORF type:complete len:951 (+),score=29.48 gnl/MRDRNA2_/MRDRNA2_86537_c0_seq1:41-2854(+)
MEIANDTTIQTNDKAHNNFSSIPKGCEQYTFVENDQMNRNPNIHKKIKNNIYPTAHDVYGDDVEILVQNEDTQPLEVPIIPAPQAENFSCDTETWKTKYSTDFLIYMLRKPNLARNVAVVGHLHHGKTTFIDILVNQTHVTSDQNDRFMDNGSDEQLRGISIKMNSITLILDDLLGKSYSITLLDTPGHVNFIDEVTCALKLSDGVLLCVDAAEGAMLNTEKVVKQACLDGLRICLFITKLDRLIIELKIPPPDAYDKIRCVISEVDNIINSYIPTKLSPKRIELSRGNICFGSALYGFTFTLDSIANIYCQIQDLDIDYQLLASKLSDKKSFTEFILEPLYKIFSQILGEEKKGVDCISQEFTMRPKQTCFNTNIQPLIREICSQIFRHNTGLVSMIVNHIPDSKEAGKFQKTNYEKLEANSPAFKMKDKCKKVFVANVVKLIPKKNGSNFGSLARVIGGTVNLGAKVRVVGPDFSPDYVEDSLSQVITQIEVLQGRYCIATLRAYRGNVILLGGVDTTINKTASVLSESLDYCEPILKSLEIQYPPAMKIAIEPLNPSDLPKMVDGLRKIDRSYPLVATKVEESGENVISGSGELYFDCLMNDLRELYSGIEIKISDPLVALSETILEPTSLKCLTETPNKKCKLCITCVPLEKGLDEDIQYGAICLEWTKKKISKFFQNRYEWDILRSRRVWAFGPGSRGSNILIDDTLPSETNNSDICEVKDFIIQGFRWSTKEGPLCEETVRNVKFLLLDIERSTENSLWFGGQLIATARRSCYCGFLLAAPRLMEPVYFVEITTPAECIAAIYNVLSKRRGHVTTDSPKPGTPIFIVYAYIPLIESFGFETDLRYHTLGQAFCLSIFDHWSVVPGDPLDKSFVFKPLEPVSLFALAREFMVKTRRRKAMSEDVTMNNYFDDPSLIGAAIQKLCSSSESVSH